MIDLSPDEFNRRARQVRDAYKIFGHMTEHNITLAYKIYRDIFEEKDLPEIISYSNEHGKLEHLLLSPYVRPKCPKCGSRLNLRHICAKKGPSNINGYRSCWECMAEDCYYEEHSTRTVVKQLKQLKRKGEI